MYLFQCDEAKPNKKLTHNKKCHPKKNENSEIQKVDRMQIFIA